MPDKDGKVDLRGIRESRPAKGWNQMNLIKKLMINKVSGDVNLTPHQEIVFICSGNVDHYKTSFAVFGFRYVQIEGDIQINPEDFTAIAVYSDMEQTGEFTCSNPLVNRLVQNTRWSMKGNFLDVPTDCPTRERLGWTGDAQIFLDTGFLTTPHLCSVPADHGYVETAYRLLLQEDIPGWLFRVKQGATSVWES